MARRTAGTAVSVVRHRRRLPVARAARDRAIPFLRQRRLPPPPRFRRDALARCTRRRSHREPACGASLRRSPRGAPRSNSCARACSTCGPATTTSCSWCCCCCRPWSGGRRGSAVARSRSTSRASSPRSRWRTRSRSGSPRPRSSACRSNRSRSRSRCRSSSRAILNLVPRWWRLRLPLAFGFGLVHGFGFANALAGLDTGAASILPVLAGFNVGVEARQPRGDRLAAAASLLVGAASPGTRRGRCRRCRWRRRAGGDVDGGI